LATKVEIKIRLNTLLETHSGRLAKDTAITQATKKSGANS